MQLTNEPIKEQLQKRWHVPEPLYAYVKRAYGVNAKDAGEFPKAVYHNYTLSLVDYLKTMQRNIDYLEGKVNDLQWELREKHD